MPLLKIEARLAQNVCLHGMCLLQPWHSFKSWVQGLLSTYCVPLLFLHIPYMMGAGSLGATSDLHHLLRSLTKCLLLYQEVPLMSSNNKALCSTHWLCLVPWGAHICTYLFLRCLSLFSPFSFLCSLFERGTCIFELAAWLRLSASIPSINRAPLPSWSCLWLRRGKACCQNLWLTQQLLGALRWLQSSHNGGSFSVCFWCLAQTLFEVNRHSAHHNFF